MTQHNASKTKFTGPWDLNDLLRTPEFTMKAREDGLRDVYYENEPCGGKPTRVFAYYGAPDSETKVPAMVLAHGGGGKAFPEWVRMWVERGYAALAMDFSGRGPDGERLPDAGPDQTQEDKFSAIGKGVREAWSYHAVAAVIRGASVLASRPEVDADRIGITGISWGGYLTCIVAGLDDRLKVAIPVYGCGFIHENSAWLDVFAQLPEQDRQAWIENFEPSHYLPQAYMPMLWLNGTNDSAYPLDSYQKSYRLPAGPRALAVTVRMPHGHTSGWAPVSIGLFADRHLRNGAPLPDIGAMALDGDTCRAPFESVTRIESVGLHYTTDAGKWIDREWHSLEASVDGGGVTAALPSGRPLVCFLTITDERGATVSTEHVELVNW